GVVEPAVAGNADDIGVPAQQRGDVPVGRLPSGLAEFVEVARLGVRSEPRIAAIGGQPMQRQPGRLGSGGDAQAGRQAEPSPEAAHLRAAGNGPSGSEADVPEEELVAWPVSVTRLAEERMEALERSGNPLEDVVGQPEPLEAKVEPRGEMSNQRPV